MPQSNSHRRKMGVAVGGTPAERGRGGGATATRHVGGEANRETRHKSVPKYPYGHLRYSTGEAEAVRKEMERELRLQRLQQVREQSREHAAAVREEYRQRHRDGMQEAVEKTRRDFETTKRADLAAMNSQLQQKLLGVGCAHRLAVCTKMAQEREGERIRATRSVSAERRRSRTTKAIEKRAAELREAGQEEVVAHQRLQVWRGIGEAGRSCAKDYQQRRASRTLASEEQRQNSERQQRERAVRGREVKLAGSRVTQVYAGEDRV
ncbi:unnamed protein product [Choristocarpus tenellus]